MHLSVSTASPQSWSSNQIVALKVKPPFKVSWKVRNGARVRAGQLLAVVQVVRASTGDAQAEAVPVNDLTLACESAPTCHRILAHCAGRVTNRRFTRNEEVTELDTSENARWLTDGVVDSGNSAQEVVISAVADPEHQESLSQPIFFCRVVDEPCGHAVIVEGLCADCGDSVSLSSLENDLLDHRTPVWSSELSTVNATQTSESLKAAGHGDTPGSLIYTQKLGFVTPGTNISVSSETAKSLEREKVLSLLRARKLPLILDLDNTLLHAYPLPPPPDITELLKDDPCQIVSLGHPSLYVGGDTDSEPFSGEAGSQRPEGTNVKHTSLGTSVLSEPQEDENNEKEQGAPVGCNEELSDEHKYSPANGTTSGDVSDEVPQGSVHTSQYLPHYAEDFWSEAVQKVVRRWESWVISVEAFEYSAAYMTRSSLPSSSPYSSVSFPPFYLKPYTCYYKLRPGVLQFLRLASQKFELYLFTAGTAIHASSSLRVLDPERKWFGSRVFTREDLPQLENGMLGLKTIQRIFPGETTTQNLVTVIDDCEAVWLPNSNVFKVHAYHWWPDPSLHPFLLLYCRRTSNGAGSHSEVPVKYIDPASFSRIRAASFSILNFCPSIIELCQSPRKDTFRAYETGTRVFFPPSCLDGGHSSAPLHSQENHQAFPPDITDPSVTVTPAANAQTEASENPQVSQPSAHVETKPFEPCSGGTPGKEHSATAVSEHFLTAPKSDGQVNGCTSGRLDLDTVAEMAHDDSIDCDELEGRQSPCKRRCLTQKYGQSLHSDIEKETKEGLSAPTDGCETKNVYTLRGGDTELSLKRKRHNNSANLVVAFRETNAQSGSESHLVAEPDTSNSSFFKTADTDQESLEKAECYNGTEPIKADASLPKQNPWLEKNFDRRRKGETWDELNARVLQTTTESWSAPKILRDSDRQLPSLWQILNRMHTQFFQEAEDALHGTDPTDLPSVKNILDAMRQEVLRNVVIKTTGIREAAIPHFEETDLGRASIALGARLIGRKSGDSVSHTAATHLLVGKETEYYMDAKKNGSFPHVAHLMWLEAALFTFTRFDESLFPVDLCEKQYRVFWDALENQESLVFTNDPSAWVPCRVLHDDDTTQSANQKKARTSTASKSPLSNGKSVESTASCVGTGPVSAGQESVIDFLETEPSEACCTAVELNALEDELLTAFL